MICFECGEEVHAQNDFYVIRADHKVLHVKCYESREKPNRS